jgi:flagellar basal body-associated protein FliL
MKKQTKIIIAVLVGVLLLAVAFVYKLHWFAAGMKPQQAAINNPDSIVQAVTDKHEETSSIQNRGFQRGAGGRISAERKNH